MRLDRFLCHATGRTRTQAQRLIRAGDVRVDGEMVTDPGRHVADDARVEIDRQPVEQPKPQAGGPSPAALVLIQAPKPRYYMLHKPAGVVSATRDREHTTVIDLIDVPRPERLHVAGRLDADATGLVLISDDGEWSHRVMSPRHDCPKTYRLILAEPLGDQAVKHLERGVFLQNEKQRCRPAVLERLTDIDAGHDQRRQPQPEGGDAQTNQEAGHDRWLR
ncbi:MAG: pseudouridine synthase, partial [Pseudomonadota bacterium]